jgi:hypothetical protein
MSKLITVAAFIAIFVALAFAMHAPASTDHMDGKIRKAPSDPTAAMERAPHDLPLERFDAH